MKMFIYRCFSDVDAGTMKDDKIRKQRFLRKVHAEQMVEQRLLGCHL